MLDAHQLETAGFGSKTALRLFPFESPRRTSQMKPVTSVADM